MGLKIVPEEVKDLLVFGWLASDLSFHMGRGELVGVNMSTTRGWQLARLKEILGNDHSEPQKTVAVTLEGIKLEVHVEWPIKKLNKIIRSSKWLRELAARGAFVGGLPPADIEDLILRLRWDWVLDVVKRMEGDLKRLFRCGRRQCSDEKFRAALAEFEAFVAEVRNGKVDYAKAREYLASASLLLDFETAKTQEERYKALWRFGLVFAEAVAGDGSINRRHIALISGKGGPALLWLAVLKRAGGIAGFKPRLYMEKLQDRELYRLFTTGEDAVVLASLMLAIGTNPKAEDAIKMFREEGERHADVKLVGDVRKAGKYAVATIKVKAGPWKGKCRVYLAEDVMMLKFASNDVHSIYLKAHILKLLGMKTEPKKYSNGGKWFINAYTNALASKDALQKFREKLAKIVERAAQKGLIEAETAARWAEKLRTGVALAEGKPMFNIQVVDNSIDIRHYTVDASELDQLASELKALGLVEGEHFYMKRPIGGEEGYFRVGVEGVKKLAELRKHANSAEILLKADEWIKHLLALAESISDKNKRERALEILNELIRGGEARGAFKLEGLKQHVERVVEVKIKGQVRVIEVKCDVEIKRAETYEKDGNLIVKINAMVDGVEVKREWVFYRNGRRVNGYVKTQDNTPGGLKADIKRLMAISVVVFGKPGSLRSDGKQLRYTGGALEHAMRYSEIKETIEGWLRKA